MRSEWELGDDLDLAEVFGAASAAKEPSSDDEARARLGNELLRLSNRYWMEAADHLGTPQDDLSEAGQLVCLFDVDLAVQKGRGKTKRVEATGGDERWWIPCNASYDAIVTALNDASEPWDLDSASPCDLICEVKGRRKGTKSKPGAIEVAIKAAIVQGGLAAFSHPRGVRVPGFDAALAKLDNYGTIKAPVGGSPDLLIRPLVHALEQEDFALFESLWSIASRGAGLKRRYEQFHKHFLESGGDVTFDGYDPRSTPDDYERTKRVRMYIKRRRRDGSHGRSPVVVTKDGDDWRLLKGII